MIAPGEQSNRRVPGAGGTTGAHGTHLPARGSHASGRPVPRRFLGLSVTLWLALAALLPFAPVLRNGFTFDDRGVVVENPAVWAASPIAAWTSPYWPGRAGTGLYRPWTTFSFWWSGKIAGRSPVAFHAVNLLLHLATVLLLHRLLRHICPGRDRLALAAALLFAVHPLHSEAVASIVGRAELWAAALGFFGWLLAIRFTHRGDVPSLAGAALAFALAMLSKESAAGFLLLPALHLVVDRWSVSPGSVIPPRARTGAREPEEHAAVAELTDSESPAAAVTARRRWLLVLGAWGALLILMLLLRARILGDAFGLSAVSLSDNALFHEPALRRVANALGIQWLLVWRTLLPWNLVADASYPQIVPGPGWMASGVLFLAATLPLALFAWRRRDRELAWGIGIVLAGGFVTSNIPMAVGTIYGERLAYVPSAGSLLLLVVVAARVSSHSSAARRLLPVLAVAWGLFLAGRSWARTLDWKDDLTLFRATTAVSPRSAKAWTNLSVTYLERDRVPEALSASERALELLPGYAGAREARGTSLTRSGRAAEAVQILRPALLESPPRPRSLIELGNAWLSLGQGAPAESAFAAAARVLPPQDTPSTIGLASAYALQGRWREAASTWRRAAAGKPDDPAVQRSFAWSLWQAGSADSAEVIYRTILARNEREVAARNDLAWLLAHSGRRQREAVLLARAAFRLQPDADIADTLLESLLAAGDRPAARAWIDSLAASPPASISPQAIHALRERWEKDPRSGTLDDR